MRHQIGTPFFDEALIAVVTWVIPGSPLPAGAGWKIWYCRSSQEDFGPEPPLVFQGRRQQEIRLEWNLLSKLAGLDRRMGILTVTLANPSPGALYDISLPEEPGTNFRWRSLPDKIDGDGIAFLMASCFWQDNDREGTYSAAVQNLTKLWKPAFKLLMGDQVYADWPSDYGPDFTGEAEVELYAGRYADYWGDSAYRQLLQSSPNFFMCDDHEFWNDYPERQIHLSRSLPPFRDKYASAALELYRRFQACLNPGDQLWYSFDIGEVSFFVADSRSERDFFARDNGCHFFQEAQWQALEQWGRGLRGPGVLVLGQPIYQKDGDWRDHSLSNFAADYGRLWALIEGNIEGKTGDGKPHDVLVLSGDIHTGRLSIGRRAGLDAPQGVPEFIASAACMIQPGSKEPEEPDYKFTVRHRDIAEAWEVDRYPYMTLDNNIAMVRLLPGTNGRVLFELSLFQIRPYDARTWWDKLTGTTAPAGTLVRLFRKEIELR